MKRTTTCKREKQQQQKLEDATERLKGQSNCSYTLTTPAMTSTMTRTSTTFKKQKNNNNNKS